MAHITPRLLGIYGNLFQDSHLPDVAALLRYLAGCGFQLTVEESFRDYLLRSGEDLPEMTPASPSVAPEGAEAVVSFGGDGTFLHAACWTRGREIPILGVNTGTLGYLAGFGLDDPQAICEALSGRGCRVEPRAVIELKCDAMPPDVWPFALNEVAVLKAETAGMIVVRARLDGEYLTDYQGDGLIVATPTGSTGYNLSVGGPILQPTLPAFTLAPVAPHSLTQRPLTVSGESEIELKAESRDAMYRVSLDGRSFTLAVKTGSILHLRRAPFVVPVVVRASDNFASTLRAKLHWGRP